MSRLIGNRRACEASAQSTDGDVLRKGNVRGPSRGRTHLFQPPGPDLHYAALLELRTDTSYSVTGRGDEVTIEVFPFRYRDPLSGKWVAARYLAERHEIAERYREWEITGPPEIRGDGDQAYFRPYPPRTGPASNVERKPALDRDER